MQPYSQDASHNSRNTTPSTASSNTAAQSPVTQSAASQSASPIAQEFKHFLADIEELIEATTSLTGEDLARAKAKLTERIQTARDSAEAMGHKVMTRTRETAAATDRYVHEQPWKAVGISALLGLLTGALLARRH